MSTDAYQELQSFHQFIGAQLNSGGRCLSPEEAVEAWRLENRTAEEYAADVQAIREALEDMDAGDKGIPWDEFDRDFRKRHNLDGGP
jgi:hypothetical protein